MDYLYMLDVDAHYLSALTINLLIAFAIIIAIRYISGAISSVSSHDELSEKDNPAFGISIAGVAIAVTIMMSGVMSGEASGDLTKEAISVAGFGILGLFLMFITHYIFDKISMPKISIKDEIMKGNISAAIVEAGNIIATAIIIRAAMIWTADSTFYDVIIVLMAFVMSQIILIMLSKYRLFLFRKANKGLSMQHAIEDGNIAIAWRYIGYKLGIAMAITASSGMIPYTIETPHITIALWVAVSAIIMLVISILVLVADKVILNKIDVRKEVDEEKNMAIGIIQFSITLSIGLIIAVLAS